MAMLRGRFGDTSGRPYLEGRLILPDLRISTDISFCVDTGADRTVLLPGDGVRMGIDFAGLTRETESVGVGGLCRNYVEPAIIVFSEPRRFLYAYMIDMEVSPPSPEIMDVPSLLGRDVLNRWRMIYNPMKNRLSFQVLSADVVVPIADGD